MLELLRRLAFRIGRRGGVLMFLGSLDVLIAIGLHSVTPERLALYKGALAIAPLEVWAGAWAFVGIVCLVQSVLTNDRFAFMLAEAIKVLWASTYLAAWIVFDQPTFPSLTSAYVWATFGGMVLLISGWMENNERHSHLDPDRLSALTVRAILPALAAGADSDTGVPGRSSDGTASDEGPSEPARGIDS